MDEDAFAHLHRRSWDRLRYLSRRRKLTGAEVDELVVRYRQASLNLAYVRSHDSDLALVRGLSSLVAEARARIVGRRADSWSQAALFFTHRFPAALYSLRWWWGLTGLAFIVMSTGVGAWVANSASAREDLSSPKQIEAITKPGGQFERYYFEHEHGAFATHVWTNNAWVAAGALFTGILLVPSLLIMGNNAFSVGVMGGLMSYAGRLDAFFGYILPHGILELTAIFIAGGAGLKLGWTLVDPGQLSRGQALLRQGQITAAVALGLVGVLLVAGLLEGFVTPSGLPALTRVMIGAAVEICFMAYIFVLGRAAALDGFTGAHRDIDQIARAAGLIPDSLGNRNPGEPKNDLR